MYAAAYPVHWLPYVPAVTPGRDPHAYLTPAAWIPGRFQAPTRATGTFPALNAVSQPSNEKNPLVLPSAPTRYFAAFVLNAGELNITFEKSGVVPLYPYAPPPSAVSIG